MPLYVQLTICLSLLGVLLVALIVALVIGNTHIRRVQYTVTGAPNAFDGFKIVHVSDLHNKRYGKGQKRLLTLIAAENPDLIAVTGDLFQSRKQKNARAFLVGAVQIAPVVYVLGNHECVVETLPDFLAFARASGVTVLENETLVLQEGDDKLTVVGMRDPLFFGRGASGKAAMLEELRRLCALADGYRLLLTHRPELFDDYVGNAELILAGHSHAGHVRLPFIGAFYTPGEKFKVRYDVGRFERERSTMLVSGGLGCGAPVPRVFNRPQLLTVTLRASE